MLAVVSTIAPVIKLALNSLKVWDPSLNFVYDPTLTYESSIAGLRNLRTNLEVTPTSNFPLLSFNRSTLQLQEGMRKVTAIRPIYREVDTALVHSYAVTLSQFTLQFGYIHQDFQAIEQFEILYNAYRAANSVRTVSLRLDEIGSFDYTLWWKDLNPIPQVSAMEGAYYKMLSAEVEIKGPFLALNTPLSLIKRITFDLDVRDGHEAVFQWEVLYPIDVSVANNTLTVINNWTNKTIVQIVKSDDANELPTPLSENKFYYVIHIDDNRIQLALTPQNAIDHIPVVITDTGTVESGQYFIIRAKV